MFTQAAPVATSNPTRRMSLYLADRLTLTTKDKETIWGVIDKTWEQYMVCYADTGAPVPEFHPHLSTPTAPPK